MFNNLRVLETKYDELLITRRGNLRTGQRALRKQDNAQENIDVRVHIIWADIRATTGDMLALRTPNAALTDTVLFPSAECATTLRRILRHYRQKSGSQTE